MPTRPTTLGVTKVLQRLGVKGQDLPEVGVSSYQPVLVMGDFSRTLAAEPLEARGVCAFEIPATVGLYPGVSFLSVGPGGSVIERIRLHYPGISANFISFQLGVSSIDLQWIGAPTLQGTEDVGGWPIGPSVKSVVKAGNPVGLIVGGPPTMFANRDTGYWDLDSSRIYVGPGRYLVMIGTTRNEEMCVELWWREMAEAIGLP